MTAGLLVAPMAPTSTLLVLLEVLELFEILVVEFVIVVEVILVVQVLVLILVVEGEPVVLELVFVVVELPTQRRSLPPTSPRPT